MHQNKIGLWPAMALVVANMIGTGIFTSLGYQVGGLPSVSVLLVLWALGGLMALSGAVSYLHMMKKFPGSGGEFHYISTNYPSWMTVPAAFASVIAGFCAPTALACLTFASYLEQVLPEVPLSMIAIGILSLVTMVHSFGVRLGSRFQLMVTILKSLLILMIICVGMAISSDVDNSSSVGQWQLICSSEFAVALIYVSFSYSGWNACIYIFAEVSDAKRTIRYAVIYGTLAVTLLYLLLNYVFLRLIPFELLRGRPDIGLLILRVMFGEDGGKAAVILMSLILTASISAMVWIGGGVIQYFLKRYKTQISQVSGKRGRIISIGIQYILVVMLILTGTFRHIMLMSGIVMNVLAVLSVLPIFKKANRPPNVGLIAPSIFVTFNLGTVFWLLRTLI